MDIQQRESGDFVVLHLRGRLDANWCQHVETSLTAVVRGGQHRLHVDMADVSYISSAGLRVLLACHKQLRAIHGVFGVVRPSEAVRSVLELSGLEVLIAPDQPLQEPDEGEGTAYTSTSARYQVFRIGGGTIRVEAVGDASILDRGTPVVAAGARRFGDGSVAVGIGALGNDTVDTAARSGEFLAVAGIAAFQPTDGSSRPDFMMSEGALIPEGRLLLGLIAEGRFSTLVRFEATSEARAIPMSELAAKALDLSGASAVVIVAITETAGLVGATLRKSPTPQESSGNGRFDFPQIRDWLSFTSERAHRDSTSLLVGVVSKPGSPIDSLLRPIGRGSDTLAHIHAATFPYRPIRKGRIELKPSVTELFEGQSLQALLHLVGDPRGINGAGESEFFRGAVWIAPVTFQP